MQIAYVDGYIHVWATEVDHKKIVDGQKAWRLCITAFKMYLKDWTYNDVTKRWIFDDTLKNRAKLRAIKKIYYEPT